MLHHGLAGERYGDSLDEQPQRERHSYATAFPDFHITIEDLFAEADHVTLRWTFSGTHQGPLAGIAASGKSVSVQAVGIFNVDGGKANELRLVWDKFALMQQIGALPVSSMDETKTIKA